MTSNNILYYSGILTLYSRDATEYKHIIQIEGSQSIWLRPEMCPRMLEDGKKKVAQKGGFYFHVGMSELRTCNGL